MKRLVAFCILALGAATVRAQWKPGEGVANDQAGGANVRDVVFVVRDATNGYGYRQYALPVGLTALGWSAPNFESSVYGIRLNLGWGGYEDTFGIDGGFFSSSRGDFGGLAVDLFGTCVSGTFAGLAIGLVNLAVADVYGVQVGVVNVAERLHGVQFGLLNYSAGVVLPLVNVGF